MRKFIITIAALALLLCVTTAAHAETALDAAATKLPQTVQIQKNNDVSAAMLSKLLGTEWQSIAGGSAADDSGGAGKFAGVLVHFLALLNLVAMSLAAMSIVSHYGIAAVESARHGKAGGDTYNAWTMIRHSVSFIGCVPVTSGGLSAFQVFIVAMLSLSINFANVVWDSLGSYLVSHAQTGVIDNVPPFVDEESTALIRPMFRALVAQEALLLEDPESMATVPVQDFPSEKWKVTPKYYKSVESAAGGKFAVVREPLSGAITIYLVGTRSSGWGEFGGISIPAPVRKSANGQLTDPDDAAQFNAMEGIAEARAAAVIQMWEALRPWARYYLSDPQNANRIYISQQFPKPEKDGLGLARQYRDAVMNASKEHLEVLKNAIGVQKMLSKAIDSDGTESKLGWVSAGLMPYTFSRAQKRLDDATFGGGATFINVRGDYELSHVSGTANSSIKNAYAWSSEALLQGRLYQPVDQEGDGAGAVNRLIAGIFLDSGDGMDNEGILSGTLAQFARVDPIVAISDFGRKCYGVASSVAAISIGSAALSWVPLAGKTLSAISTSPAITGLMYGAFAVGLSLFFLPPIAILMAWVWALLKWALTVVYVMIGAPLWAVAHGAPEGAGFVGEHARQGYYVLLDLLLRPTLLVGGVVTSLGIWQAAAWLYNTLLSKYLNGFTAFNGSGLITELIFAVVIFMIIGAIYLKIFTFCVNSGPSLVMDMFGRRGAASLDSSDHDGQHVTAGAAVATTKGGQLASSVAGGIGGGVSGGKDLYSAVLKKMQGAEGNQGSVGQGNKADLPASITPKE